MSVNSHQQCSTFRRNAIVSSFGACLLALVASGGAAAGNAQLARITAALQPATLGDAFNMSTPSVMVGEGAGSVTVTVQRQGVGGGTASVDYATSSPSPLINATPGVDYTSMSGTLTWADGDLTSRNIVIPILEDSQVEANELFVFALTNPQNGGIGVIPNETIIITDNDVAAPPAAPTEVPTLGAAGAALLMAALALSGAFARRRVIQRLS